MAKRIKQLEPPDSIHLNAAIGWLELGDHLEANEELEQIAPQMRVHPDVLELRWQIYAKEKKWEAYVDIAATVIKLAPERADGWIHRSFALHELKRTQKALDHLLPVADRFSKVWTIPYNLACYCAQLGRLYKARALRAQLEAKELNRNAGEISGGGWDAWVPQFLERHCESPRTHERYQDGWKWLAFWLQEKHYHSPHAINCIDFAENKITFPSPKGGEERAFSVPMPSALLPLFERIRKAKQKFTVEFPFQPSRRWQQFFIKIKKPHLCFHCLRVTYVNRLRRAGVPREAAMRLVNHASELIDQIYQREKVEDVAQWRDAVQFPA